jgi:hypothetical protein
MAAQQFKLTHFDGKGTAEITRYLFHLAGKPFEVIQLSCKPSLL